MGLGAPITAQEEEGCVSDVPVTGEWRFSFREIKMPWDVVTRWLPKPVWKVLGTNITVFSYFVFGDSTLFQIGVT